MRFRISWLSTGLFSILDLFGSASLRCIGDFYPWRSQANRSPDPLLDLLIEYEVRNGRFTLIKNQGIDSRIKGTLVSHRYAVTSLRVLIRGPQIVLAGAVGAAQTVDVQHQVTALSVPITYEKVKYTLMSYAMWRYLGSWSIWFAATLLAAEHLVNRRIACTRSRISSPSPPREVHGFPIEETHYASASPTIVILTTVD